MDSATLTAADLAASMDRLLADARADGREVAVGALEELYTTGCAQVLELEAEVVRLEAKIGALREQVRHVRTAAEWLREQPHIDAIGR